MNTKRGVLDRIEQSFILFKENYLSISLPLFIYYSISLIIYSILLYLVYKMGILTNITEANVLSFFSDPNNILIISISIFVFLLLSLLIIPFHLATWKSIVLSYNEEKHDYKMNIKYGFTNILSSFRVYWNMFAYVALGPALLFILGGILFNLSYYLDGYDFLMILGGSIMGVSSMWFIVNAIYRGNRIHFAMANAVEKDDFSNNSFYQNIGLADNNWWRIFGNFLLVGIIISLVASMITGFLGGISMFLSLSDMKNSSILSGDIQGGESLETQLFGIMQQYPIFHYFKEILLMIVDVVATAFVFVFTFIFMKRLEEEQNNSQNHTDSQIEL